MSVPTDRGSFAPHVLCRCEQCALKHGDQADLEQVEIENLRNEVVRLKEQLQVERSIWKNKLDDAIGEWSTAIAAKVSLQIELKNLNHTVVDLKAERDGALAEAAAAKRERNIQRAQIDCLEKVLAQEEVEAVRRERLACASVARTSNFVDGPAGTVESQIAAAILARGGA